MEKVKRLLLAFLMMFILSVPTNVFADGDGNIDNGGGTWVKVLAQMCGPQEMKVLE